MDKLETIPTCAIARSIHLLGDKWSLLILRDMLFHKKSRFKEFMESKEKIATNILTKRIKNLINADLISLLDPNSTKKSRRYIVTEKGISTLPIIMELYMFSINDIHENVLNEKQLKFKQQILANRKYFESSKMDDYIAFKQGLLNEVKKTKKSNLNCLN